MKKLLIILPLILILATAFCNDAAAQNNDITIPLSNPSARGKLKVNLNSGSITVKAAPRKDVLVRYSASDDQPKEKPKNKNKNNDTEVDDRAGLKRIAGSGLDVEITEYQNTVTIGSGSFTQRVNIEVEIPVNFDAFLHTYNNGFIMITGVEGALELQNFNGKITALNISGSVVASTYNGDIKVTFDKATPDTPMSFTTFNGDVEITVPQNFKTTVKAKTEQGNIYSDFDIEFRSSGPVQKKEKKGDVYRVVIDEWKLGDINGGGAELTMQNYNGDLVLRKKK